MLKHILLAATAVTFITSGAGIALAQDAPEKRMQNAQEKMHARIMEKDADGNGAISKAEFLKGAEERFAELDVDNSGEITKDEFKAHHEKMRQRMKDKIGDIREKRQERRQNMADDNSTE